MVVSLGDKTNPRVNKYIKKGWKKKRVKRNEWPKKKGALIRKENKEEKRKKG